MYKLHLDIQPFRDAVQPLLGADLPADIVDQLLEIFRDGRAALFKVNSSITNGAHVEVLFAPSDRLAEVLAALRTRNAQDKVA